MLKLRVVSISTERQGESPMNVLGIVPARGGSKSIPRKNLAPLGGEPLISWTLEAATQSLLTRVMVSTDDVEIADVARKLGADVPFLRPKNIARDTTEMLDVVEHAMTELNFEGGAVMVLQPTSPFRSTADINACLELLIQNPEVDSVISVVSVGSYHPARMKYLENGLLIDPPFGEERENQRRQELKQMYIRNGAIYLTRRETLKARTFKGRRSLAYVMPEERSINIDSPYDLALARAVLSIR